MSRRKTGLIAWMALAALAGGCNTLTTSDPHIRGEVDEIIRALQCQLRNDLVDIGAIYPEMVDWAVTATITLTAQDTVQNTLENFSWTIPGASISLGPGASRSQDAQREMIVEFHTPLSDLDTADCTSPFVVSVSSVEPGTGLFEPLAGYARALASNRVVGVAKNLSYTVTFTTDSTQSLKAGVDAVGLTGDASTSHERKDIHLLALSFSENTEEGVARARERVEQLRRERSIVDQLRTLQ